MTSTTASPTGTNADTRGVDTLTGLAVASDPNSVEDPWKVINIDINHKGTARYVMYHQGQVGGAITDVVFFLKWLEPPQTYDLKKLDLNAGAKGLDGKSAAVPIYLATTKEARDSHYEIVGVNVIKATATPPPDWTRVDFNLNTSVKDGEALNLIIKKKKVS